MSEHPVSIGIMICTCERPVMLQACLKSLIGQDVPDGWSFEICVVENDENPQSKSVVDGIAETASIPVHYALETKRGIPFARNRTLREALERGYQWIALIDDDETARTGWLLEHINAVKRHEADVSYGFVVEDFETPPPGWSKIAPMSPQREGEVLTRASTCNVFFDHRLIDPAGTALTFNPVFAGGYEDLDFFERAHLAGHKIVAAPAAIVDTRYPASRTAPERILQSAYAGAAARAQASYLRKGTAKTVLKFGFDALRRLLSGLVTSLAGLVVGGLHADKGTDLYYKGRLRLARGLGSISGLLNKPSTYYDTVDGS